jgi:hypothetical protein
MSTDQTGRGTAGNGNDTKVKRESAPTEKASSSSRGARVEHFSPAERAARGKAARAEVPRGAHGEWEPSPPRPTRLSC